MPGYIHSHVHPSNIDSAKSEFVLIPTFRLPPQILTRSANSKWLSEISHRNPVWIHPADAQRLGVSTGDLLHVATEIGYFVNRAWVTESIKPGILACSHHLGRWRSKPDEGSRWTSTLVRFEDHGSGTLLRHVEPLSAFESSDPDSSRIWWSDGGVHQNLAFPVQPDPISGMHCWHQKISAKKAPREDRYGDVFVDRSKAREVYTEVPWSNEPTDSVNPQ